MNYDFFATAKSQQVNSRNRKSCEICSKLTIKTSERFH